MKTKMIRNLTVACLLPTFVTCALRSVAGANGNDSEAGQQRQAVNSAGYNGIIYPPQMVDESKQTPSGNGLRAAAGSGWAGYVMWDTNRLGYYFRDGRPAPRIICRDQDGHEIYTMIPPEVFPPQYRTEAGAIMWDKKRKEYRTRDGSPIPMVTYYDAGGHIIYSGVPVDAIDPAAGNVTRDIITRVRALAAEKVVWSSGKRAYETSSEAPVPRVMQITAQGKVICSGIPSEAFAVTYRQNEGALVWDAERAEYHAKDGSPVPRISYLDRRGEELDAGIPLWAVAADYLKNEGAVYWDKEEDRYRTRDGSPVPTLTVFDVDGRVLYSSVPPELVNPDNESALTAAALREAQQEALQDFKQELEGALDPNGSLSERFGQANK